MGLGNRPHFSYANDPHKSLKNHAFTLTLK